MNRHRTTRDLLATLAAVAALLSACTGDPTPTSDDQPSTSPSSASPSPSGPPLVSTLPEGARLDPGPYALSAGPELPLVVLDVPSGFQAGGDFLFGDGAIGYWAVTGIYKNPCTKRGGVKDVGSTVDDLATALASQPLILATKPVPVSLGGYDGAFLELTAPKLDYNTCTPKDVAFWRTEDGDRFADTAGKFDRVWVLDVKGNLLVINAAFEQHNSTQDIEALTTVVESARFIEPDDSSSPG
jgi:hypothetical protein